MKKLTNEILKRIKDEKKSIIIYGAGVVGKIVLRKALFSEIDVYSFAVSDEKDNPHLIEGKNVVGIEYIKQDKKDMIVIVSMLEEKQEPVINKLRELGFCNIYVITNELYAKWEKEEIETSNIPSGPINYYQSRMFLPYLSYFKRYCKEIGVEDDLVKEYTRQVMDMGEKEEALLNRMVVVLGTKCSLRCRDCNNLIPYFKPQKDLNVTQIIHSLDLLMQNVKSIMRCELIGGEPFLSNNLETVLDKVLSEEKIVQVEITTNGTIIPSKRIVHLLKNKKIKVRISDYGDKVDKQKIINFLEEKKIKYELLEIGEWLASGDGRKRYKCKEQLEKEYLRCPSSINCKTIYEDKLFDCARAASLYELGYMRENEYLVLDDYITKNKIIEFWIKHSSMACDYCDYMIDCKQYVEPAIQL